MDFNSKLFLLTIFILIPLVVSVVGNARESPLLALQRSRWQQFHKRWSQFRSRSRSGRAAIWLLITFELFSSQYLA